MASPACWRTTRERSTCLPSALSRTDLACAGRPLAMGKQVRTPAGDRNRGGAVARAGEQRPRARSKAIVRRAGDRAGSGRSDRRQLDRELGDVAPGKAIVGGGVHGRLVMGGSTRPASHRGDAPFRGGAIARAGRRLTSPASPRRSPVASPSLRSHSWQSASPRRRPRTLCGC